MSKETLLFGGGRTKFCLSAHARTARGRSALENKKKKKGLQKEDGGTKAEAARLTSSFSQSGKKERE